VDFGYSEEQRQLVDSIRRLVERHYDFDARRRIVESRSRIASPRCMIEDPGLHDRVITASNARHSLPDLLCTVSPERIE